MPDGGNLRQAVDDLALAGNQRLLHLLKGGGVIRHGHLLRHHPAVAGFMGDPAVDADALAVALGHDRFPIHIDQLILQRRTACVDNQNLHVFSSIPFL